MNLCSGFNQERHETFQRLGFYQVRNLVWGLLGLVSLDLIQSSIRSSRTFGILGALGLIHCCFRLTLHAASVGVGEMVLKIGGPRPGLNSLCDINRAPHCGQRQVSANPDSSQISCQLLANCVGFATGIDKATLASSILEYWLPL